MLSIILRKEIIDIGEVNLRRGLYQGDSLNVLWFCEAEFCGVELKSGNDSILLNLVLNHLLYMINLKLYTANRNQLESAQTCQIDE